LEGLGHLVEKVREISGKVVRQVGQAEPFEGFRGGAAQFYVVGEIFKIRGIQELHVTPAAKAHPGTG
jgi:hypothetical protein